MTAMSDHLTGPLRSKLERHSIVVWTDAQGEYRASVQELVPSGATLARFDGSWYELRRREQVYSILTSLTPD